MKQTCPKCKTIVEIEDSKYNIGDVVDVECPVCGEQLQFCIQKNLEIISDSAEIEDIQEIPTENVAPSLPKRSAKKKPVLPREELDPLLSDIATYIVQNPQSALYLVLYYYYNVENERAEKILNQLEYIGIIGPKKENTDSRDVLVNSMSTLEIILKEWNIYEDSTNLDNSPVILYDNNTQPEYNNHTLTPNINTVQVGDSVEAYKEWERSVEETKRDYTTKNKTLRLENAGCWGIGFSFVVPIIGIVLYFAKKDSVNNPGAYITATIIGFVIRLIIYAI